jgi:hypothetical protein
MYVRLHKTKKVGSLFIVYPCEFYLMFDEGLNVVEGFDTVRAINLSFEKLTPTMLMVICN